MTRFYLCLVIFLFGFILSGFGQKKKQLPPQPKEPLQDSVDKYTKIGQYAKAIPFAEKWVEQAKKEKGNESAEYGKALHNLGRIKYEIGKHKEAEPILIEAIEVQKKALGEEHPDVAGTLHNLGLVYKAMGYYPKAEEFYVKALDIYKKALGEVHPDVAGTLNNLGLVYYNMGNYPKAEEFYLKALDIRRKALGEEHPDVAGTLHNLGLVYKAMGYYPKAEEFYVKALDIYKKALGEEHPKVAGTLNNLGNVYSDMGNYPKAEEFYLKALDIRRKALGEEHPGVAESLHNLGNVYKAMGYYPKAEEFYVKALDIRRKALGEEHRYVAETLNNLGNVYFDMGNYPKAEEFYLKALDILKKALGEEHPSVAKSLNNLGVVYDNMGNYPKAEEYHLKALAIRKKALSEEHQDVAASLNNLGKVYEEMGNYLKAEDFYLKALYIYKEALGEEHPDVAMTTNNLGIIYDNMGNYPKAESFLLQSSALRLKALGTNHPDILASYQSLASYYRKQKQFVPAEANYTKSWNNLVHQIQNYFPFLSDNEKAKFFEKVSEHIEVIKSFYLMPNVKNPAKTGEVYNQQLFTKALLLSSSTRWKQLIKSSGDKELLALFTQWELTRNKIAKLYTETDSTLLAGLDSTLAKSEKLEKELSRRSEAFGKLIDRKMVSWKDVQAKLKPGEAAIEIIRMRKWGIAKVVTDTSDPQKPVYKIQGLTDTIQYIALIVKPGLLQPELVMLPNGNDMEGKWINYYKNTIRNKVTDKQLYDIYWQKIADKLGKGVKTIYFSPDGIYNSINLNTLQNPKTGKYLLEEKDIRLLTNTKDLVTASNTKPNENYACLVGYPEYNADKTLRASVLNRERKASEIWYNLNLTRGEAFAELPATKAEVEKISDIMGKIGWKVETLLGEKALEDRVKEVEMPRVLHIATHGYFQPDTTKGNNPLIHSGLLLTGANKTLAGEKSEDTEDGILTAYEAMNLNLDNTDLVVLSACETGLGEIKNGEGVYGLQRAFKVAGAKSIIMSLWKVDDQATQELMVSFYKNWLSAPNGNKRTAFLKAQKQLKAKYPNPYYWGAFVMVGE
jgi:CHAT domain-containing protein/Tfp pilus assembly protein PilF